MTKARIIQILAPFAIILIIIVFILNIYTHGSIQHPGLSTYQTYCAQCHGDNGEGIRSLVPPLNRSDFAMHHFDSLACWIKFGMNHPIFVNDTAYDQPMYPNHIDEIQTANVINYMSKEFFGSDTAINSIWVKEKWKTCE